MMKIKVVSASRILLSKSSPNWKNRKNGVSIGEERAWWCKREREIVCVTEEKMKEDIRWDFARIKIWSEEMDLNSLRLFFPSDIFSIFKNGKRSETFAHDSISKYYFDFFTLFQIVFLDIFFQFLIPLHLVALKVNEVEMYVSKYIRSTTENVDIWDRWVKWRNSY